MAFEIPVYRPTLDGNEKKYVNECLDTTWISSRGRFIDEFEAGFAKLVEAPHAVSVCNGTVALHVALLALGIGPGDEVIVPTFTYIASVNAITYTGATPVFVDSLPDTWQLDPADVRRRITNKTRAIMAVHLYGHPCDVAALAALASDHKLFLVEDCAEAVGTRFKGRHVGLFGDVGTFSFFGNKTLTTGEGGMLTFNDAGLAARARHLKGQGLAANREYWHDLVGYNYRMTNIEAAIGVAQLETVHDRIARKRELAQWYDDALKGLPVQTHREPRDGVHSYWMYSILMADEATRDCVRRALAAKGIETRPTFQCAHSMPIYPRAERYPVAERLAATGMNLPSWPGLTRDQVRWIADEIRGGLEP